jgi:ferredoxin
MATITFEPFFARIPCADGESIFEVGRRHGVPIATTCFGKATCGLCRVKILAGEEFLSAFNAQERNHLGDEHLAAHERLACQALVSGGDVIVEVPPPKIG